MCGSNTFMNGNIPSTIPRLGNIDVIIKNSLQQNICNTGVNICTTLGCQHFYNFTIGIMASKINTKYENLHFNIVTLRC